MNRPSPRTHNVRLSAIFFSVLTFLFLSNWLRPSAAGGQGHGDSPAGEAVEASQLVTPPATGSIAGRVVDQRNRPLGGVRVMVRGREMATTDDGGAFMLRSLATTERLAVSFRTPGFMEATKIYRVMGASRGGLVVLWPRAAFVSMDAGRGGRLSFPGGTVSFPPRALVDDAGRPLRGKVRVAFSALDVSDRNQLRSAPGDFTARSRDKRIRQLETFGVFEVLVESPDGRRADLAPGRRAAVELSLPKSLRRRAPGVVGLYSFDAGDGRWVEEGTLRRSPGAVSYATSVGSTLPTWNADDLLDATCVRVRVLDCDCGPKTLAQSVHVEATGVNYSGISDGYTDPTTGEVCLLVKRDAIVSVVAHHPSLVNVQTPPLEINTSKVMAGTSACGDPTLCPLTVTTHIPAAAFDDYLNAEDPALWCKSGPWANNDPAFDASWDNTPNHIDFSAASGLLTLTLTDFGTDTGHPCSSSVNCSGKSFASGEYRTKCFYGYGTYEATFQTASPKGLGLVTSFFVYTGAPDGTIFYGGQDWHDEIDIEVLGRAPDSNKPQEAQCSPTDTLMQTNYFVKGDGNHEHIICLPFDASAGLHTYRFVWAQNKLEFYYDPSTNPSPAYTVNRVPPDAPWPAQPGRIVVNTWAGNSADQNTVNWLGAFSYQGSPRQARYDEIHYH